MLVPVFKPLDQRLTTPAAEPRVPGARCKDYAQRKTVCHRDEANYIDQLRKWGRGMYGQIMEIAGLQPKPEDAK